MKANFENLYQFNIETSSHLANISQPLQGNFGISFLSYRRFYKTGELAYLINNQHWMELSFSKGWINSETFYQRIPLLSSKGFLNYVWPEYPPQNDSIYHALYDLNIRNGIALYKSYDDYIEAYAFSSQNELQTTRDLYLNNIEILDRFILYFREKVRPILQRLDASCVLKHKAFDKFCTFDHSRLQTFLEQTAYKRFYLRLGGREFYLSKKETECLSLLALGKSIKEIGCILEVSPRTIETHINNAKIKTDLPTTSKLLDVFLNEKRKYQI